MSELCARMRNLLHYSQHLIHNEIRDNHEFYHHRDCYEICLHLGLWWCHDGHDDTFACSNNVQYVHGVQVVWFPGDHADKSMFIRRKPYAVPLA